MDEQQREPRRRRHNPTQPQEEAQQPVADGQTTQPSADAPVADTAPAHETPEITPLDDMDMARLDRLFMDDELDEPPKRNRKFRPFKASKEAQEPEDKTEAATPKEEEIDEFAEFDDYDEPRARKPRAEKQAIDFTCQRAQQLDTLATPICLLAIAIGLVSLALSGFYTGMTGVSFALAQLIAQGVPRLLTWVAAGLVLRFLLPGLAVLVEAAYRKIK